MYHRDWLKEGAQFHLSVLLRTLLQLTVDITNLGTVVEGDRAQKCRDYFCCILNAMEVGRRVPSER